MKTETTTSEKVGPSARRRKVGETDDGDPGARDDLRAGVVRLCERVLRETIAQNNLRLKPHRRVDTDTFVGGIHQMRARDVRCKAQRRVNVRAASAVLAIRTALEQAPAIFASGAELGLREVSYLAQLRRLVGPLERLEYLGGKPAPWDCSDDEHWSRRMYVLHEFDSDNFLGMGREATVAELTAISLLLDPEHGCGDPRRADARKPYQIMKQERDAIARDRKADAAAAVARTRVKHDVLEERGKFTVRGEDGYEIGPFSTRQEAEDRLPRPYEPLPPEKAGPHVKHLPPGKYVFSIGGRPIRIGEASQVR